MAKKKEIRRQDVFTDDVSVAFIEKAYKLSNSARYDEVYSMAKKHLALYPDSLLFAYYEAVFSAEQDAGFTPAQIKTRHQKAAAKLKKLLRRLRGAHLYFRASVRNEYYWFSHQPYKQYLLGKEMVAKGRKGSVYSQGVGATELAKAYALKGKRGHAQRWARIAEDAWLKFFKVSPKWYNSHLFYAAALGYQDRLAEMDKAFARAAKIAGKSKNWSAIKHHRKEVIDVLKQLDKKAPQR